MSLLVNDGHTGFLLVNFIFHEREEPRVREKRRCDFVMNDARRNVSNCRGFSFVEISFIDGSSYNHGYSALTVIAPMEI